MKATIIGKLERVPTFKPFTLSIEINDMEDFREVWHRFNIPKSGVVDSYSALQKGKVPLSNYFNHVPHYNNSSVSQVWGILNYHGKEEGYIK